jgi:hypothetical protein
MPEIDPALMAEFKRLEAEADHERRCGGDHFLARLRLREFFRAALEQAEQRICAIEHHCMVVERDNEGLRKANELLRKGMESQAELMDGLKQQMRSADQQRFLERRRMDEDHA